MAYDITFICFIDPPNAPVNFHADKIGQNFVTLQWKAPKDDGGSKVTGYHLKKKIRSTGDWEDVASLKETDFTYKIKGLKENVDHYFSVCAENSAGVGPVAETKKIVPLKEPSMIAFLFVLNS